MWAAVFVFAVMAMWDPVRVGVAVFVVARSRPVASLFVFCIGGIASSLAIGLAAVFLLRSTTERLIRDASASTNAVDQAHVKIGLGVLALVFAAGLFIRQRTRRPVHHVAKPVSEAPISERPSDPTLVARLSARGRSLLRKQSLWVAFLAGLWAGPGPHVELIGALGVILASGAAAQTQAAAVVVYTIVSFAFAEIPLVSYLVAPERTSMFLNRVPEWLRARRAGVVAVALSVLGTYLVVSGALG
ncbi:GAP family protein [Mycolicibacterium sp. 050158]|uniref:GAP family protein n=1 Tax=Mycolicibacterium sp. 050158 TaxID=3090602 RepID=UPI00299DA283|nr:GAP family protein [Mycolicibacterium sp. 050158]MDX1892775.1 GAP family protein [Mycolicibacterium sp. 050158]